MLKQLIVVALAAATSWVSAQPDGQARPVQKVGDVAVFAITDRADRKQSEETVTVVSVEGGQIKTRHTRPDRTPPDQEGISTTELSLALSGASGTRYDPPIALVKFPLAVGSAWKSTYESASPSGARSKGEFDFKVTAAEKLTTPAGAFDTFKIETEGWVNGISWQGSVRVVQSLWYAPSIGRFVKTEYKDYRGSRLWNDNVFELKSFTPGP